MEILIILAVLVIACWFLFFRESSSVSVAAPYKVETPPTPEPESVVTKTGIHKTTESVDPTPVPAVVEVAPVVETAPVVEAAPAKKPRKPRGPKVVAEKPAAKKAAPVKKAAAIKAAPKKPRSKKA
jgi:hypothetical protein